MKINEKLHTVVLVSAALILVLLIIVSSTASAATEQSALPAATCAYITNYWDDTVSVIDTATNTVTATVPVELSPYGIAVNPAGTRVYVVNLHSHTISVIDTATNTVIGTIGVRGYPYGIAVNSAGTRVYATSQLGSSVSVIDTATNTVIAKVPVGSYPKGVAVTPDGTKVYVASSQDKAVSVIDTATNTVTATVPVGGTPFEVAVSPDGTKVYATNYDNNTVSVIDTATNTVTATITVEGEPDGVAVNPAGTKVYVVNSGSNTVSVIDTATNDVMATVPVGSYPQGVAVTPDGTKVYVANDFSNNVSVIDTVTNTVIDTVNVGNGPIAFGQFIGSVSVQPVLPIANFSAKPTSGKAPLNVLFKDKSTGYPTKWKWSFGDGTNSTKQSPIHKYSKAGIYTVSLTAKNAKGSNTVTKTDYIKVVAKPVAEFSASPTSGKAPLTVAFTDKSTGSPTKWKWTFGDGKTSTQQNPTYKYSKAGNYKVTLTVTNAVGSNTTTKTNYIKVVTKPVANFSANPTSGKAPLNVAFTDKSTGYPTKWKWSFGDGTNSTQKNTTHKYSKAGNYTVSLTVSNAAGNNTTTKTNYIKVTASVKPVAAFSAKPTSGIAPLNVAFTDNSTGTPTKWSWAFGDGTNLTGNTTAEQNPKHQYLQEGNYTVNLTVTNAAGSNTTTKTNYIKVTIDNTIPGIDPENK